MRTRLVVIGLALAALASGCGGSSGTQPPEHGPGQAEATRASQASSTAASNSRLEGEAHHWVKVAEQAEAAARGDLSGGRSRKGEADAALLNHADREIERIAQAIEGETEELRRSRERLETER